MKRERYCILVGLFLLLSVLFGGMSFFSEIHAATPGYPEHPITIVVPFPAGGLSDLGARIIAEAMEKNLKQAVVVANKTGGGGTIGGYAVTTAKPDGYTLGYFASQSSVPEVFSYFYQAPYSSKDLKPISKIHIPALGWTVQGDAPWNSLNDVVEFARKNPGMKVGHPGKTTVAYLSIATVARAEKVEFVNVPYEGDAKIVPAILGGHIPVGVLGFPAIRSLFDSKKVKVLALCLEQRADFAPEIPTVAELYKSVKFTALHGMGLFAPKGTPDEVVKRIDEVIHKITEEQDFRSKSKGISLPIVYENTASFEKSIIRYKEEMQVFLKEEGLVKAK